MIFKILFIIIIIMNLRVNQIVSPLKTFTIIEFENGKYLSYICFNFFKFNVIYLLSTEISMQINIL